MDNKATETMEKIRKADINIYMNIISLKAWYENNDEGRAMCLAELRGFLEGLRMTGFITEEERNAVAWFVTI